MMNNEKNRYLVFLKAEYIRDAQGYTCGNAADCDASDDDWPDAGGPMLLLDKTCSMEDLKACINRNYPDIDYDVLDVMVANDAYMVTVKKDAKNKYFPLHEGDRIRLSGDSCDLGIKDYNVRVDSEATVVIEPHDDDSKVLVNIDYIDGESNVCVSVKRDKLSVIISPSYKRIQKVLAESREKAAELGVELHVDEDTFVDDDHLDTVWYGGELGWLKYAGYEVHFEVTGEVFITGTYNGEPFEYRNKNNDGAMSRNADDALRSNFFSDEQFHEAIQNCDIEYENNNWVEAHVKKADGEWIDEVVDDADDVLDVFSNITAWVDWLEREFINADTGWICTDPDTMQWRREAPEKGEGVFELAQVNEYVSHFKVAHGFVYPADVEDDKDELIASYDWPEETINSDNFPAILAEASFESGGTEYDSPKEYDSFEKAARALGNLIGVDVETYLNEKE